MAAYQEEFQKLRQLLRQLKALSGDQSLRQKRAELLRYEINEIEKAKLSPRLEEVLTEKSRQMRSAQRMNALSLKTPLSA